MHGNSFGGPITGSFLNASNGAEPKLAWARSLSGTGLSYGFGWGNWGSQGLLLGGRTARDSVLAANVSNDLATSNALVATMLLNLTTQAVGQGLTLSSKPIAERIGLTTDEARKLSHSIETAWNAWAANPREVDNAGRFDLHQLAAAAFRSYLLNGEAVAVLDWNHVPGARTKTKVTLLDALQLDRTVTRREGEGPNERHILTGVVFDKMGRVIGYMLREMPLGDTYVAPIAKFVPAFTSFGRPKVLHIFEHLDARQVRGLSPLVGALTPAHEESTLSEFALGKALIDASFTTTIESNLPTREAFDALQVSDRESRIFDTAEQMLAMKGEFYSKAKITPEVGTLTHLAPGDKLIQHKSATPSNTFEAFDKSLMRKAAKAGGAAYEDLTGDFSATSFSASRMATALPHEITLKRRKDIVESFYAGVYRAWFEESIATGEIELPAHAADFYEQPDAYLNARFLGKGRVSPDEKKSAEAQLLQLENGLMTLSEALAENGRDFEAHVETLLAERRYLASKGLDHPFGLFAGAVNTRNEDVTDEPEPEESKNADEAKDQEPAQDPTPERRGRGRPKGSKNRPKTVATAAQEYEDDEI